jgi:hypothetical protein
MYRALGFLALALSALASSPAFAVSVTPVPEPGSLLFLAVGAAAGTLLHRARKGR